MLKDLFQRVPNAFANLPDAFRGTDGDVLTAFGCAFTHGSARVDRMESRQIDSTFADTFRGVSSTFGNSRRRCTNTAADLGRGASLLLLFFRVF